MFILNINCSNMQNNKQNSKLMVVSVLANHSVKFVINEVDLIVFVLEESMKLVSLSWFGSNSVHGLI